MTKRLLLDQIAGHQRNGVFNAGAAQLAVGSTERAVIAERRPDLLIELARIASRDNSLRFPGGLHVISKTGVDVWDGHQLLHTLEAPIKFDASRSDESSYVAFSADGRYFADETDDGLVVYDLRAARALFTRRDLKSTMVHLRCAGLAPPLYDFIECQVAPGIRRAIDDA